MNEDIPIQSLIIESSEKPKASNQFQILSHLKS